MIKGDIDTPGEARAGQVVLISKNSSIVNQDITTAIDTDTDDESGTVSLNSSGSIEIEFIDATGFSSNTTGPLVSISSKFL
ncbi:MAG: hypothetical protein AAFQ63_08625 [Cyanobacteria bacterium J06621_11]